MQEPRPARLPGDRRGGLIDRESGITVLGAIDWRAHSSAREPPSPGSPRPDGSPWPPDSLSTAFAGLIRRSDLPRIRFHDLRHSHATQLLRHGIHPKVVSERLGHSKVGITLDTYSHVLPGMQEEAAQKIDASLRLAIHDNSNE
ncbi:MAG: site-specific integrase [Alphaproteobacteria bacterium]|nr:site-specific integrase [Alphaproteobacteria bacterium]